MSSRTDPLLLNVRAHELPFLPFPAHAIQVCSRATMDLLTRERLPELTTETR